MQATVTSEQSNCVSSHEVVRRSRDRYQPRKRASDLRANDHEGAPGLLLPPRARQSFPTRVSTADAFRVRLECFKRAA